MNTKGVSRIFTNNVSEMKYGLHFAKVATGELAFMHGYMCAVKPRQMSEFTTKNVHMQEKRKKSCNRGVEALAFARAWWTFCKTQLTQWAR